jgi:hypothetical protein
MNVIAAEAPAPAWLVCLRAQRDIVEGAVACPLSGSPVPVAGCLECRHLEYVAEERRASPWCSTCGEDRVSPAEGRDA